MQRPYRSGPPLRQAARLALLYAVAATAWITLSDSLLELWFRDPDALSWLQTIKGTAFVLVTAAALWLLVYRQLHKADDLVQRLERQRSELDELNQFRRSIIDNASIWLNVIDPDGQIQVWNQAAESISGYDRESVLHSDRIWANLYPDPDYRTRVIEAVRGMHERGTELSGFETTIRCRDGDEKVISWDARRFFDENGRLMGSIAIGQDVTERRRAETALRARERQLATLLSNLPGMAYRCLNDGYWTMKFASSHCLTLTGYPPEALIDNRDVAFVDLIHSDDRATVDEEVSTAVANQRQFAVEYRLCRRDGTELWVWEQGQEVSLDGETVLEGIIMDITQRKRMEQEFARQAAKDPLTGLPNRRELEHRLDTEISRADRFDHTLAVLWVDIDHFKTVNDRFGHLVGDDVLRTLSHVLEANVRTVDSVTRFGGEELVILLPEVELAEAVETAERLRRLVADTAFPLPVPETVTISIGVAIYPHHGRSAETLCNAADRAMYDAKAAGRNRVSAAPMFWG
ncbi:sensor domain-containing diguanylate cyclase [Arhodomonas aquaeolei]|uniref:sensor domain-containing diguanylate cyclase n=1 Tax=Arhodomonas aquaeolei TaxID=2369 RepID=UPI00037457E9|nr:diguanylate cyclase [Arhodomonas aquaeolei]